MDSIINAQSLEHARALATAILTCPANCRLTAGIHGWLLTQSILLCIMNHAQSLDEVRDMITHHMATHRTNCRDRPPTPYRYRNEHDDDDDDDEDLSSICA